jgi:aminotransferase
VIVEDDVFVGGNVGIYEGVVVKRRAVLAAGVVLTGSSQLYDLVNERVIRAEGGQPLVVPEGAVVVMGARPASGDFAREQRAVAGDAGHRQDPRRADRRQDGARRRAAVASRGFPAPNGPMRGRLGDPEVADASGAGGLSLDGLSLSLIRQVTAAAAPGAIDLALGEPGHETPVAVRRAVAEAAAGPLRYTPNAGLPELRRALAATRPHHGGGADSVLVTVGSQEALALAVLGLVRGGDEVVVPRWAYPSYEALPHMVGARVVRAEVDGMAAAVGERTKLVIIGSPANPTGEVLRRDTWRRLAALADERGFLLLSDEVYAEVYLGDDPPPIPEGRNVLHVGGISKSLAATGLRCGWLIADPAVVARLVPLHQHLVTCAPVPSQRAALAGLTLPEAEHEAIRDLYRARWRRLEAALSTIPGLPGPTPPAPTTPGSTSGAASTARRRRSLSTSRGGARCWSSRAKPSARTAAAGYG